MSIAFGEAPDSFLTFASKLPLWFFVCLIFACINTFVSRTDLSMGLHTRFNFFFLSQSNFSLGKCLLNSLGISSYLKEYIYICINFKASKVKKLCLYHTP